MRKKTWNGFKSPERTGERRLGSGGNFPRGEGALPSWPRTRLLGAHATVSSTCVYKNLNLEFVKPECSGGALSQRVCWVDMYPFRNLLYRWGLEPECCLPALS